MRLGDRDSEHGARMQVELAQILADHGDHARIVRAGGDLVEEHGAVFEHEQFDAEHAPCGVGAGMGDETLHGLRGNAFDLLPMIGLDGRRLPGITVIAAFLPLANRFAHHNACR